MILLVDDDKEVMEYFKAILEGMNFKVDGYTDAPRALHAFEDNPDKYSHAILDVHMPRLNGEDLEERIHALNPAFPIMFLTGLTDSKNIRKLEEKGVYMKKELFAPEAVQRLMKFVS